jgi:hypothetical protein
MWITGVPALRQPPARDAAKRFPPRMNADQRQKPIGKAGLGFCNAGFLIGVHRRSSAAKLLPCRRTTALPKS